MAELWWLLLGLGVAVFLVVAVVLVLSLFRRRQAGEPQPGRQRPNSFGRWFVVGGRGGPAGHLDHCVRGHGSGDAVRPHHRSPRGARRRGRWPPVLWEVRYPDSGITVTNELHIPVGRPVNLQLTFADVIHSFWVPALAGKLDLLPARTNTLVLQADQPGRHTSRCAEYCGLEHTKMLLTVVAEPEERFAAWVAERRG
jgi:cytochrome c oxidase subunit 2